VTLIRASDPGVDGFGAAGAGADEQADQRAGSSPNDTGHWT
jgi:hypothetical protein